MAIAEGLKVRMPGRKARLSHFSTYIIQDRAVMWKVEGVCMTACST